MHECRVGPSVDHPCMHAVVHKHTQMHAYNRKTACMNAMKLLIMYKYIIHDYYDQKTCMHYKIVKRSDAHLCVHKRGKRLG
jgi:hypothetical protein